MKPHLTAALVLILAACSGPTMRIPSPVPTVTETVRSRYAGIEVMDVSLPTYASGEEIFTEDASGLLAGSSDVLWADDPTRAITLSLARAGAVAAYLDSRGIAKERLVVVGAGSSLPVADNATRYGRSINRRIEIQFRATSD